ncbi:hypothetical protein BD311DRAFT_765556 [Dichomitus squalens]|uniref:Uncharacterized protein n=1 Tax=Dichomitus squalens TaxID=114155 RepID=A0A4Q9MCV6_9APHY|nr:hypothetical protein BD311DRAFT_765556 [Dichomitus squalens]
MSLSVLHVMFSATLPVLSAFASSSPCSHTLCAMIHAPGTGANVDANCPPLTRFFELAC